MDQSLPSRVSAIHHNKTSTASSIFFTDYSKTSV